jgi:replicative DNA helicase
VRPVDIEVEIKVLSAAVLHSEWWASSMIDIEDFSSQEYQRLYSVFEYIYSQNEHCSRPNVELELRKRGWGGALSSLVDQIFGEYRPVPTALELGRLRDLKHCRRAMSALSGLGRLIEAGDVTAVRDRLENGIGALEGHEDDIEWHSWHDLAKHEYERQTNPQDVEHINAGLEPIREYLGDFEPGEILSIGGWTNVGKSSIAFPLMWEAWKRAQVPSVMVSVEDPKAMVQKRVLALESGVSSFAMRQMKVRPTEFEAMRAAVNAYSGVQLQNVTCTTSKHTAVLRVMRRFARVGYKLFVIDYLQCIRYEGRFQDRRNEVRLVLEDFRHEAKRLGVVLVVLSQLRRPEKRSGSTKNPEPTKHDFKEAGDIEEKSDGLIAMWREKENDYAPVRFRVLKGKSGGVGKGWTMRRDESGMLKMVNEDEHPVPF